MRVFNTNFTEYDLWHCLLSMSQSIGSCKLDRVGQFNRLNAKPRTVECLAAQHTSVYFGGLRMAMFKLKWMVINLGSVILSLISFVCELRKLSRLRLLVGKSSKAVFGRENIWHIVFLCYLLLNLVRCADFFFFFGKVCNETLAIGLFQSFCFLICFHEKC